MKIHNFLTGNFSIFSKAFKNLIKFFSKIWKILDICVFSGSGGDAPEASEFIIILVEKSKVTCNFLIIFVNYERIFLIK